MNSQEKEPASFETGGSKKQGIQKNYQEEEEIKSMRKHLDF